MRDLRRPEGALEFEKLLKALDGEGHCIRWMADLGYHSRGSLNTGKDIKGRAAGPRHQVES